MKNKVTVSAPGKLMLFGEHSVVHGRPCIVTSVNQRVHTTISFLSEKKIVIDAPDVGINKYESNLSKIGENENLPKGVRFVEQAILTFSEHFKLTEGVKVVTKNDFSSQYGFGSSSAVTVGTIAGLSKLANIKLTKKQIFDLCYETVLKVQGIGSGFDVAAAIWGGTLYYVTGGVVIEPIQVEDLPLVIGYTGIKADTPTLVRGVANFKKKHPKICKGIFDNITAIVEEARKNITEQNFKKLGKLMNKDQELLEKLGVSSEKLEDLIDASKKAGAYGAKLSGAGGGDCMIALSSANKRKKVETAIRIAGGSVVGVKFDTEGVKYSS